MFVDQCSRYAYVHLQCTLTSNETVQAKHNFKRTADEMGVSILHYHADGGRFVENGLINDC